MKTFYSVLFSLLLFVPYSFGAGLVGTVSIEQTSDTAAKAKTEALNLARRQILSKVLSNYSEADFLNDLLEKTTDDDLMNLVSSTSVSGEHISATVYSATITMNLDNDAIRLWLAENNVKNWVPGFEPIEKFTAFIVLPNGISDWAEIKRIARDLNIDIDTQHIMGNQIIAKMPLNSRTNFTLAIRDAGWHYADNEGVLQIWK